MIKTLSALILMRIILWTQRVVDGCGSRNQYKNVIKSIFLGFKLIKKRQIYDNKIVLFLVFLSGQEVALINDLGIKDFSHSVYSAGSFIKIYL